jgi:hypothetical protein
MSTAAATSFSTAGGTFPRVILDMGKEYHCLMDRAWWLLVAPVGSRFICSDNPVLMENAADPRTGLGFRVPGDIVYLPLSPHLMLMVADNVHLPDRQVAHIGAENFRKLQWLTGFNADRFVYGHAAEDLDVPEGAWVGGRSFEIVSPPLAGPQVEGS